MSDPLSDTPLDPSMERMEMNALENLVVAAAVNKRLLMRILAHLEGRDPAELHDEVAALDHEFRQTVRAGMSRDQHDIPEEKVRQGELPVGREEERRGNALENKPMKPDAVTGAALGKDQSTRNQPSSA